MLHVSPHGRKTDLYRSEIENTKFLSHLKGTFLPDDEPCIIGNKCSWTCTDMHLTRSPIVQFMATQDLEPDTSASTLPYVQVDYDGPRSLLHGLDA